MNFYRELFQSDSLGRNICDWIKYKTCTTGNAKDVFSFSHSYNIKRPSKDNINSITMNCQLYIKSGCMILHGPLVFPGPLQQYNPY